MIEQIKIIIVLCKFNYKKFKEKVKNDKNPYIFKVNGKLVRISFSDTDKTTEDCLTRVLENLYRWINNINGEK